MLQYTLSYTDVDLCVLREVAGKIELQRRKIEDKIDHYPVFQNLRPLIDHQISRH